MPTTRTSRKARSASRSIPAPVGLMRGYQNDDGSFAPLGTKPIAPATSRTRTDGYFTYVGRADDVFKASDYRISPFELESALIEHPAVAEAAVVPAPDPMRLAVPKAYVMLPTSASPIAPRRCRSSGICARRSRRSSACAGWSSPICRRRSPARSAAWSCARRRRSGRSRAARWRGVPRGGFPGAARSGPIGHRGIGDGA